MIHPEGEGQNAITEYEENFSLDELRLEIHDEIGEVDDGFTDAYSEYSTTMWSRLEDLFRLIDEGEETLGIPPYNGGLFNRERHEFLTDHEVSNRYLAEVLYRISTTENDEGRYVLADYADLDTRHLGSVYEGLLEHQFRIAPEEYAAVAEDGGQVWKPATEVTVAEAVEQISGGLYVVNDEGERKATGRTTRRITWSRTSSRRRWGRWSPRSKPTSRSRDSSREPTSIWGVLPPGDRPEDPRSGDGEWAFPDAGDGVPRRGGDDRGARTRGGDGVRRTAGAP